MNRPFSISVVLTTACWLLSYTVADADDRSDLASYFDAHEANWSAIQTMDAFCHTDILLEPGLEPGITETTYERLLFDEANDRYTYAKVNEKRLTDTDEVTESIGIGFIIKDGMYRSFMNIKKEMGSPFRDKALHPPKPIGSREQVFDDHRVPDWRILMLMTPSRGGARTWTQNKANLMQYLPQRATSVRRINTNQDGVTFESFYDNGAGFRNTFRDEDLMPSKVVWLVKEDLPNTTGPPSVLEVGVERYTWRQTNKVFVPDAVEGNFRERQFRMGPVELQKLDFSNMTAEEIKKLFVDVTVHRDMQFAWLGVNSALADELFDFASIDDPDKFLGLCAPSVAAKGISQD
jgi:hypothetical protein